MPSPDFPDYKRGDATSSDAFFSPRPLPSGDMDHTSEGGETRPESKGAPSRRTVLLSAGALGGAVLLGAQRLAKGGAETTAPTTVPATVAPATTPTTVAPATVDRLAPFRGYGVWWDVYDWSPTFTSIKGRQLTINADHVDRVADAGVQTIYVQTGHHSADTDILDEPILTSMINRAHDRGMKVVGWYVPTHQDMERDLRRTEAPISLGVDGMGLDVETDDEPDVGARNARLIWAVENFAGRNPDTPFASIPNPPVLYDELNHQWWPNFPYKEVAPYFDVWMPMAYWTLRKGQWADPYLFVKENNDRLRAYTENPNLPLHPIGGLAEDTTAGTVEEMGRAMRDTNSIGGSLYDDATTNPELYGVLKTQFTR